MSDSGLQVPCLELEWHVESVGPSARSRAHKAAAMCRSCLRCRSKKIKCSSERPKCASCISQGVDCIYREDARRSGTIRGDVHSLQKEISSLRQLLREYRNTDNSTSSNVLFDQHSKAYCPLANDQQSQNDSPQVESEGFSLSQYSNQATGSEEAELFSSNHVAFNVGKTSNVTTTSNTIGNMPTQEGQKKDSIQADIDHASSPKKGPSPSEVNLAGAFTENGQVLVHGVTSIHRPSFTTDRNEHGDAGDEKRSRYNMPSDRLVSYAAIQRQQELFALNRTKIDIKLDLDGVAPEMAKHLLDLHWNRQHYAYLLTYRPAFMDSLTNDGPHANKLLLNAIYYLSCLFSDRMYLRSDLNDPQTMGDRFYRRFKELLIDEIDRPSIPTAVALMLCGICLISHGKQSGGWVLCGTGYRMIVDLGCHLSIEDRRPQNTQPSFSSIIDLEIRKRVYWGAFVVDKFHSLYLGRPPTLRPEEARVSTEFYDTFEEWESWTPYRDPEAGPFDPDLPVYEPRPAYAVSTFLATIRLTEIATKVIDAFYTFESIKVSQQIMLHKRSMLLEELKNWRSNLPSHLHFDPNTSCGPPPHQITPHTTYWTLIILIQKPFLSNGHFSACLSPQSQSACQEECTTAALKIADLIKVYKNVFTLRRAPYQLCYAAYTAVLVIFQQCRSNQERFSECVPFLWSALLDLRHAGNAGLKKPLQILKTLFPSLEDNSLSLVMPNDTFANVGNGNNLDLPQGLDDTRQNIADIDFFQNMDLDTWNTSSWLDKVAGDQVFADSSYGIFTAK